jgi:polyisoprenoid-binding protein YceI
MKKLISLAAGALLSMSVLAQTSWKSDPLHSKLTFSVTHMSISDVAGLFKTFEVKVSTNQADFSDAVFEFSSDVASVNTEVEMRDNHLRSADFFDVQKYPSMQFKSTSIKKEGNNKYKLTGDLTLHGITKPVTMNLWYRGTIENPQDKSTTAGFQLTGIVLRSDFGIGTKFPEVMLGNEVSIRADGEFKKIK